MIGRQATAIIDHDVGLQLANRPKQLQRVPILGLPSQPVEPHDIDLAVVAK